MTTDTILAREAPGTKETITRDDIAGWTLPEVTGLRKLLGPEWYRLLRGVVTNPLSVIWPDHRRGLHPGGSVCPGAGAAPGGGR